MKTNIPLSVLVFFLSFYFCAIQSNAQLTPYEIRGKNYTATYQECIDFYSELDKNHACISMQTMGMTDAGEPLHLILLSSENKNSPEDWQRKNMLIIFINNGIHPGEPDGIDASMMMVRDIANKIEQDSFPQNIALAMIPIYNIGGTLLRSEFNRVDQNGPESFGSRGNSQNLDLNRDFIKCDSKEARSFSEIFQWLQPDIFIDNHVSDGADYQHVITLATTQHNKLGGNMGLYIHEVFDTDLFQKMKRKNYPMVPYVNVWGKDAKDGWTQFFDAPRYSSGYAAMFNTFAFTIETHMLKPYNQRVDATYKLMDAIIEHAATNYDTLKSLRKEANENMLSQTNFPISWKNDETKFTEYEYLGYQYKTRTSQVSGLPVKFYDRNDAYSKKVKIKDAYIPTVNVTAPLAYIIPQSCWKVIDLLKDNQVEMMTFEDDQQLELQAYKITNYKSNATPYEGHHANYQVEVESINQNIEIRKGDYYIPLNQKNKRFIIEVLEPQASDSYFSWNFFDPFLIQKEGYSDYAYEDNAAQYLEEHPELRKLLNEKCFTDSVLAKNAGDQLEFVYSHSPYPEPRYNMYPIYRVLDTKTIEIPTPINKLESGFKNKEDE